MRLIQVARKLQITQNEIIEFLHNQGIKTKRASNTKLEDEYVKLVYQHFNPELLINDAQEEGIISEEVPAQEPEKSETSTNENIETPIHTELQIEKEAEVKPEIDAIKQNENEEEEIEVIRPQLIKLEGVKVIGKIDLPEPPAKTTKEQKDSETPERTEQGPEGDRTSSKSFDRNRIKGKRQKREVRTPLTYEEKIKRDEERKLRKQQSILKKEKKKKFKHYYKNVQSKLPAEKPTKKLKKKEMPTSMSNEKQASKNPLKRFWSWLNGEYDQF